MGLAVAMLPLAASAVARADDGADDDTGPGSPALRVEVTGSNIRRIEGETALPVQVITREDLARGGVQTAQDLLARISANQSFGGANEATGIGGRTATGFTAASLRGLGAQRTLVLLDGRRLAPYALSGGQGVDLSAIPASALERIEILKDGASAVYGTDAIGGVINFILRKDYAGVELYANDYATEAGGGGSRRIGATAGTGSLARDGHNFFISADHFQQQSLRSSARASTRTAYRPDLGLDLTSPASFPANILQSNPVTGEVYGFPGVRNPTIPWPGGPTANSCLPPDSLSTPTTPFVCRYDSASQSDALPESEKTTVLARFTCDAGPGTRLFAEAAYYRGAVTESLAATPALSGLFEPGRLIVLPPSSPYYPAGFVGGLPGGDPTAPLVFAYRTVELGPRVDRATVDQWNAVTGITGSVAGWDYALAAQYTGNRQVERLVSGWVSRDRFAELIESGVVNPFGPNTPDALARMRAAQITGDADDNRASNYGADFHLSGTAFELPAGPLAFAFGAEWRRERLQLANSDFIEDGDVLGNSGVPSLAPASRSAWALSGEVNLPLARALEVNLALRHDHYSDFGGTTNPKLSLRWQPTPASLLRAAYGTGFRAPTLFDVFQPASQALGGGGPFYADPVRCPVTGAADDCSGLVTTRVGGNRALQPETSRQINAGVVLEPATGLAASLDYYRVVLDNVIGVVGLDAIYSDFARWAPGYVVRAPPDAAHPGLPGPIDHVVQYPTNVGRITTSGLDIGLRWRLPSTPLGQFALAVDGAYVIDYRHSDNTSEDVPQGVGTRGLMGAVARYRQYATLDWSRGAWGATLANTFQSGYLETDVGSCDATGSCPGMRRVGSYSLWDLQMRFSGWRNALLRLGVINLLDRAPPASNQQESFQVGIDPSYADLRGRTFYAALSYAFR